MIVNFKKKLIDNILIDVTDSTEENILGAIDNHLSKYDLIVSDNEEVEIRTDIDFICNNETFKIRLERIDDSKDYIVDYLDNKYSIRITIKENIKRIEFYVQCDVRVYDKYDYRMYSQEFEHMFYSKEMRL